ncbi:MAG TPA: hypothetical protein VHZ33_10725 [Trebonia sp.]|nr:hypothetical protein [Trebonia sp.]
MTDVACFCGCCFSFDGGAAPCPRCGQVASVTGGPALEGAGRSQPRIPVPVVGYPAVVRQGFDRRGVQLMGLSVDTVDKRAWAAEDN